jgi:hypothetical protein
VGKIEGGCMPNSVNSFLPSNMPTQLIAFPYNGGYTYGELVDNHIMRGSSRALYVSNMTKIAITPEWRAYLSGVTFEVEMSAGWKTCKPILTHAAVMLETTEGYKIPLILLSDEHARYYPAMMKEPALPHQAVRAPPVVVHTAPAVRRVTMRRTTSVRTTRDDCESEDEGRKELDALHMYVASQRKHRQVSFK